MRVEPDSPAKSPPAVVAGVAQRLSVESRRSWRSSARSSIARNCSCGGCWGGVLVPAPAPAPAAAPAPAPAEPTRAPTPDRALRHFVPPPIQPAAATWVARARASARAHAREIGCCPCPLPPSAPQPVLESCVGSESNVVHGQQMQRTSRSSSWLGRTTRSGQRGNGVTGSAGSALLTYTAALFEAPLTYTADFVEGIVPLTYMA